jgi:uncharacterized metal-binding protein YceD (DUF177 family)
LVVVVAVLLFAVQMLNPVQLAEEAVVEEEVLLIVQEVLVDLNDWVAEADQV